MLDLFFKFVLNKLNFCCGNYSRGETNQGRKLFSEIRYALMANKNKVSKLLIIQLSQTCYLYTWVTVGYWYSKTKRQPIYPHFLKKLGYNDLVTRLPIFHLTNERYAVWQKYTLKITKKSKATKNVQISKWFKSQFLKNFLQQRIIPYSKIAKSMVASIPIIQTSM